MTSHETTAMAIPRVASGVLFVDHKERVLLVRPSYKTHWDIPGGYVEPGESPHAACVREIREELGLDISVGPLLVVDWAPAEGEGDKLLFIFSGGRLTAEQERDIIFADGELTEWRYLPTDTLEAYAPARLVRRIRTAVAAGRRRQAAYAEHGNSVPHPEDGAG
ncbi:NUDIX hydrolase [Micromonospora yasonensis]|uniref:NUDIX domain-containing protein n=1 Tax=Micromonospora yasonensis TaxID=1128667 RepID=UPI0022324826|nr:NUDIX hydrolase [Micromonospora yasonensis]MCW3843903.1 NUDIX hydrolase [Micromonospora yasonensis]